MPARKKYFLRVFFFSFAFFVVVLFLSGCSSFKSFYEKNAVNTVTLENTDAYEVKRGDISITISGIGKFTSIKEIGLSYKDVSGPLKKIMVSPGDNVKCGQCIAEIDISKVLRDLEEKQLTLQISELRQDQNKENLASAERGIKLAEYDRQVALKRYICEPIDMNRISLEKANLQYEQAVSASKNAELNKKISDVQYKLDEKALMDLKAQAMKSKLLSPADGIVVFVEQLSETELINSGRVIVRIAEPENIVFNMTVNLSQKIQGESVGLLTLNGKTFNVKIYNPQQGGLLEPSSNTSKTKNKLYLIVMDSTTAIKLDEQFDATVQIEKSKVLLIPKSSIQEDDGKTMVDVLQNGLPQKTEIICGMDNGDMIEVISGLKEGDKVVTR